MLLFAPAKINIGLKVLDKRLDNYHNIESIFYSIPLFDILEFSKSKDFEFISSGLAVDGQLANNLVFKAYDLINQQYSIGGLKIHLHKTIPMGAGLGGGSSDAASTLLAINSIFGLGIDLNELAQMAEYLGADCPFFVHNKPVIARGIGTQFTEVNLDLSGYFIVLIKPDIHISTAEAYAGVKLEGAKAGLDLSVLGDMSLWKHQFLNSFEHNLFLKYPLLKELKDSLYEQGAVYASMSGSGSSIFGIFKSKPNVLQEWERYFLWVKEI